MEGFTTLIVLLIALAAAIAIAESRRHSREVMSDDLALARDALALVITRNFLVAACSRCDEYAMRLLTVSPHGRSVHYQCVHCGKKTHSSAATPEASSALQAWTAWQTLETTYTQQWKGTPEPITFQVPPQPLPYEQTAREPIAAAVRSEVWRRDQGHCVQCGSQQQLQFDHIIPVKLGGSTTTVNLQLLCRVCNQKKGATI